MGSHFAFHQNVIPRHYATGMIFVTRLLAITLLSLAPFHAVAQQSAKAGNVVLVMTDGLRWQELFRGADESLLTSERYYDGRDAKELRSRFLAPTPAERRQKLMPFFWSFFPTQGVIFGDQDEGSRASVTNGLNFSYPGYSETLTGYPDPRIHSNDNVPNPNITVLDFLNREPEFNGRVAAFGAWEVIGGAVNAQRCDFTVNVGYNPLLSPQSPKLELLNRLKQDAPRIWDDEAFDSPVFETTLEYIRLQQPRVLFLSLGETDDWAHSGNYGEYLLSANRVDQYLQRLWAALQAMPQYRDNTTLIFTTDHGRGNGPETWKSHGEKLPESKDIFIAVGGTTVPHGGLLHNTSPVTQSQIAATLAQVVGKDWNIAESKAGLPLNLSH